MALRFFNTYSRQLEEFHPRGSAGIFNADRGAAPQPPWHVQGLPQQGAKPLTRFSVVDIDGNNDGLFDATVNAAAATASALAKDLPSSVSPLTELDQAFHHHVDYLLM